MHDEACFTICYQHVRSNFHSRTRHVEKERVMERHVFANCYQLVRYDFHSCRGPVEQKEGYGVAPGHHLYAPLGTPQIGKVLLLAITFAHGAFKKLCHFLEFLFWYRESLYKCDV